MALLKILRKKLPAELMAQIRDELGDDFDFDYVPRTRLNAVIKQRNELRTQLAELEADEGDDLDDLGAGDDGDSGEPTAGKAPKKGKKATSQPGGESLEDLKAQHAKELHKIKVRYALTEELREAKCKNPELLLDKFDFEKLSFDEDGKLTGHTDMIDGWKESDSYLFEQAGDDVPPGTGADGAGAGDDGGPPDKVDSILSEVFGFDIK